MMMLMTQTSKNRTKKNDDGGLLPLLQLQLVLLPEDPKFFRAPATASYKDRNPASETPSHVDWDAYWECLKQLVLMEQASNSNNCDDNTINDNDNDNDAETSSCPPQQRRVVVLVEHYLLLHDPRVVSVLDGMVFLDPTAAHDDDDDDKDDENNNNNIYNNNNNDKREMEAMWMCLERRVLRNPNRTAQEALYMCRYYQDHVWPNYKKWTYYKARDLCETRGKTFIRIDCRQDAIAIVDFVENSLMTWLRDGDDGDDPS
jgi:uridine kinase